MLPHEMSGAYKNDIIPDGTQDFMLFWDVFRATIRGVGVVKNQPLLSGMQDFMLFRAVVCVTTRNVRSIQK